MLKRKLNLNLKKKN